MTVARNPRQPRGNPTRTGGTMVWLPLDLSDDEVSERMDTDAEAAYAALHGCIVCGDLRGRRCCEFGRDIQHA